MSDYNPDSSFNNPWDDREDVIWNEFDWEQYLRGQDEVICRYLAFYEKVRSSPQRLDEVARLMGWEVEEWNREEEKDESKEKEGRKVTPSADGAVVADDQPGAGANADIAGDDFVPDLVNDVGPYTIQNNPVYISTRAIYLSLVRSWERLAGDPANMEQSLAVSYMAALQRGETQSLLAIQELDFGDYALAVSLLKRALVDLNATMGILANVDGNASKVLRGYCVGAMPRLFDLREIWLRVINECRHELDSPSEDDYSDEDDED